MKQLLSLSRHSKGFDMATIWKKGSRFQVQIRRLEFSDTTKTFHQMKDAKEWARLTEIKLGRHERLETIKPISIKRILALVQHMFKLAMGEWEIPIKEAL